MAQQCLGIAEGLKKIQRSDSDPPDSSPDSLFGIHGDIKPENILWFKHSDEEHGTLKICDFGFTRYHNKDSRSIALPVGYTGTYRAPELDTMPYISRAYDVWTLGCLYLEFVTWYLIGWDGVHRIFANRRIKYDTPEPDMPQMDKFFNCTKTDGTCAVVKPAVNRVSSKYFFFCSDAEKTVDTIPSQPTYMQPIFPRFINSY
jgi:serine/threonine protein kinase